MNTRQQKTLIFIFCLVLSNLVGQAAEPIRIVCIGDSITQGGKNTRDEFTYRWPLFCKLVDTGIEFDFIGSKNDGLHQDAEWPAHYKGIPFDPDHEGVYGIETQAALARLPEAMALWQSTPDIALIHLGQNDSKTDQPYENVKAPLRQIITLLREENPHIVIALGHLNFNDVPAAFRTMAVVSELKKELSTEASPIITVHHYQNWHSQPNHSNSDTFDWTHPNPQGQEKMAAQWFTAIQPYLEVK